MAPVCKLFFFFNDTATTEIYTLSLHDALPISNVSVYVHGNSAAADRTVAPIQQGGTPPASPFVQYGNIKISNVNSSAPLRSEEHTSELQSRQYLVCRLLLEKKYQPANESTP